MSALMEMVASGSIYWRLSSGFGCGIKLKDEVKGWWEKWSRRTGWEELCIGVQYFTVIIKSSQFATSKWLGWQEKL